MANSTEEAKKHMLNAIGAATVDELFEQIPDDQDNHPAVRVARAPHLGGGAEAPPVRRAGQERDLRGQTSASSGGGTWQHHVPAICDEIWTRSEFLTSVWGTGSSDLGRNQAWFEFASQLGELVGMDFVGLPVYSWGAAVGHAMRMATRMTGRSRILVPALMDPQRPGRGPDLRRDFRSRWVTSRSPTWATTRPPDAST